MSLLSGKYLEAEQAAPGVIQTFRARDLATADPVFVHRISDANCNEQASLLRLLLLCLYRSPAVKKLVLEVREDAEACYVVTESAPQCFLLREWLELEARNAEASSRTLADLQSVEPKLKDAAPEPLLHEGGGELSLSAPFVSEAPPATPQAAPIKSIRPLPPDLSPAPKGASSDLLALSGMAAKNSGTQVIEKSNFDAAKPESFSRIHPADPKPVSEVGAAPRPFQKDATPSSGYSSHPGVQRPSGALPLDEFSRLFADPKPAGNGATTEMLSTVRSPISGPVPPPTHARPAPNPVTAASQPTPLATPILPSAAQTVLESALAAQAASQRNRNLIIGIVVVVLIVLAVVLMVLTFSRTQ